MKELTSTFNALLQDKRVRAEQSKYESITRQRSGVTSKYKRIYQEYLDLEAGLESAKKWYSEMKDTVNSLDKNVETFVNNRRSEGSQLLSHIEQERAAKANGQADRERERIRGLMERMSMDPSTSPSGKSRTQSVSHNSTSPSTRYPSTNIVGQYQVPTSPLPPSTQPQSAHPGYHPSLNSFYSSQQSKPESYNAQTATAQPQSGYNPSTYSYRDNSQPLSAPPTQTQFSQSQYSRPLQPTSPPPTQTHFSQQYGRPSQPISPPPTQTQFSQNQYGRPQAASPPPGQSFAQRQYGRQQPAQQQYIPEGYVPPPPPPGPPPLGPQQTFQPPGLPPMPAHGEYGYGDPAQQRGSHQHNSSDPWSGLNAWK